MSRQIPVASVDELTPGRRKLAFVDGRSVVLFNIEGNVIAIENSCPHNGASLANGQLDGHVLRCPAHGMRFDLRACAKPEAARLCPTFLDVMECNGRFELLIDDPGEKK
ncbi:Rieske (2Fe-2S) protein [Paraburkholderia dokdonensis]|uniref:Rieske (2Fe-2S) protein n=1 Tax=Paraburkholderia dokdonensis TaxID=2211211 RepID=UPI00101A9D34|nr:Rieske 2Fe-2S domain-containing protein [Paraburkholderia dokdonensis]